MSLYYGVVQLFIKYNHLISITYRLEKILFYRGKDIKFIQAVTEIENRSVVGCIFMMELN